MKLVSHVHDGKTDFEFLGIFAKNREEWAVIDIACM